MGFYHLIGVYIFTVFYCKNAYCFKGKIIKFRGLYFDRGPLKLNFDQPNTYINLVSVF